MLPDEVDERIVENEILERKTKKFIIQGRREDIVLKDDSRERFFDFEYLSGGREVLKKQYDNKDYLIEQVAGTKQSGKLPDSEDLDVSYRLARSSGVIFLPEAEKVLLSAVDWLAGLLAENYDSGWHNLSLLKLDRIRELRIHNKVSIKKAYYRAFECSLGEINDHLAQEIIAAIDRGVAEDSGLLPSCAVSLDTESVKILKTDWVKLRRGIDFKGETCKVPRNPIGYKFTNQLASIMIGNGTSWNVIIRFPIKAIAEEGEMVVMEFRKVDLNDASKEVLKRLSQFSVAIGAGVKGDLDEIKKDLLEIYDYEWNPTKALDLSTLMFCAGYEGERFNMQTLAYLILGVVMNKRSSCVDNRWAWYLPDLAELKFGWGVIWYALSDVLTGFNMAVVLFNLLFLEVYPDPSVVLMNIKTDESEWRTFFMITLAKLLGDCKQPNENMTRSVVLSRKERIKIAMGYTKNNPLTPRQEKAADQLHKLLSWIPHASHGGARYVEPVREQFALTQVPTLLEIFCEEIKRGQLYVKLDTEVVKSREWIFDVMLGHSRMKKVEQDSFHTVADLEQPGTHTPGLFFHPAWKPYVSSLIGVKNLEQAIEMRKSIRGMREAKGINCVSGSTQYDTYLALLEGGYHTPEMIPGIVKSLERDYEIGMEEYRLGHVKIPYRPEVSKHQMLVKLYFIRTQKEIGGNWWDDIKSIRQANEIKDQERAVRHDPYRETRVEVMRATRDQDQKGVGSVRGRRMDGVFKKIPSRPGASKRNYHERQRQKRKKMEKREERQRKEYNMAYSNSDGRRDHYSQRETVGPQFREHPREYRRQSAGESSERSRPQQQVVFPPPTRDSSVYRRTCQRLSSPARETEFRKKKSGTRGLPEFQSTSQRLGSTAENKPKRKSRGKKRSNPQNEWDMGEMEYYD